MLATNPANYRQCCWTTSPATHGFRNFGHAQEWQLLPMSDEGKVAIGSREFLWAEWWIPLMYRNSSNLSVRYVIADRHADRAVCLPDRSGAPTALEGGGTLLSPPDGWPGHSQSASTIADSRLLIGAPLATSGPAKAVPVLLAIDWFTILRFVLRQQPVVSRVENMCL
jgi:hypothetical protein